MQDTQINDKLFHWLGAQHPGVARDRERLVASYAQAQAPSREHEDWKYTDILRVFEQDYVPAPALALTGQDLATLLPLAGYAARLVFLNGVYSRQLSAVEQAGIRVDSLEDYSRTGACGYNALFDGTGVSQSGKLQLLNTIFASQGVVVSVARNVVVDKPVCLVYVNSGEGTSALNTRNLIVCEAFSRCTVESFHVSRGQNTFFTNTVSEIFAREGASVTYNQLVSESTGSTMVHSTCVLQDAASTFEANSFLLDGGIIRNNTRVAHRGEDCTTRLNGLYLTTGTQHFDTFTHVDHEQPNCTTSELYKGVAADKSTGVFAGKIFVAPGAQKTRANQANRNILLSPGATIHSKPQLEIWADDVSCTHGSTVGQLNADHLFYCQARGISRDQAVRLLLQAFVAEVVDKVESGNMKDYLEAALPGKMSS